MFENLTPSVTRAITSHNISSVLIHIPKELRIGVLQESERKLEFSYSLTIGAINP